jgi:hypothetical protein
LVKLGPLCGLAAVLLATGCQQASRETEVDPRKHDAFFLWAGVAPPPFLDRARTIYLLDGEVRAADNRHMIPLRPQAPRIRHAEVWLTIRLERLDWQDAIYAQILDELGRWERAGNRLVGLQLDFDARTRELDRYAQFLRGLRQRLPSRYRLSATGLMDWSAGGDPAALADLAGTVDEVVIQTYQGRHTIPGYRQYLKALRKLPIPYRIGLVEGGAWQAPAGLADDPQFRGYVVFLLPHGSHRGGK